MNLPKQVLIREVGPRDGLQNEQQYVEPVDKVRLIELLADAGLQDIEATSFVHPKAVPQMRDAEDVLGLLPEWPGVEFSALTLNLKGAMRAVAAGVKTLVVNISASESHSRHNANCSREEALAELDRIAELSRTHGMVVRTDVSVVFGCPYDGPIDVAQTAYVVNRMLAGGIKEIALADTAGLGNPLQVYRICTELRETFPTAKFALHIHDTRGLGLANVLAGLQAGINIVETSVGGLGGCPFVPNAPGNVATEDVLYMLHEMGIKTGVDLNKVIQAGQFIERILGRQLASKQLQLCEKL